MEHASVESTKYKRSPSAKILKEALMIISRNVKLFSAIALLVFLPSSLLILATQLAIKPQAYQILAKFTQESTGVSDYSRFLRHHTKSILLLLSEQLLLLALSWFLSVFFMVATIYASAATINYSGTKNDQYLSLKELLASIRRPGKRAAVTYLYVTLFNFGFTIVDVLTVIFMTMTISTQPSSFILTVLGANIIILSATALHMFLTAVWTLSVAVSVLEYQQEGCWYGMRALKKAWDLIRGRKLQAFRLSSLATLAMLPVSASLLWQMGNGTGVPFLILVVLLNGISVSLTLIVYVAFTIFYYDCKTTSEGGEKVIDLEGKPHYMSLIPASPPLQLPDSCTA